MADPPPANAQFTDLIANTAELQKLTVVGGIILTPATYAELAAANPSSGTVALMTDSAQKNSGQTTTGGGTNTVLARWDGTNWIVIG